MSKDDVEWDDRDLIRQLTAGDAQAFRALVAHYYAPLIAFAWRLTNSRDAAEDILQDVWLRVWRRREHLTADAPLRPYLYLAVRHAAADYRRAAAREARAFTEASTNQTVAPDEPSVLSNITQDELTTAIERAVRALPTRCREAWTLVREQGLTHAEAADIMGVSVNTVRAQMVKALSLLRHAIEGYLVLLLLVRL